MTVHLLSKNKIENRPVPRVDGLPILGNTLPFLRDVKGMFFDIYARYGEVSRTNIMFTDCVNLLSPDANELVLLNRENVFSNKLAWDGMLDPLFRNGLMLRDGEDHRFHRKIMTAAFSREAMLSYHNLSNQHVQVSIASWQTQSQQLFYPTIKRLTLELAAKIFMGIDPGPRVDDINEAFTTLVEACGAVIKKPLPGSKFSKGLSAREKLLGIFQQLIPERKKNLGSDMLSRLIQAEDEDGNHFSNYEIAEHMVFIMMAAHDTTTSALSSMVYFLAKHRNWQSAVREEIRGISSDSPQYEDLAKMELCSAVFKEALRLLPPLTVIPRGLTHPMEYKGHLLDKGQLVQISPIFTHYLPELWDRPELFDPARFMGRRQEDKRHRYAFIPFGGGAHKCLGMNFAENQVKILMFHLLSAYEISRARDIDTVWQKIPIVLPKDGLPILLTNCR